MKTYKAAIVVNTPGRPTLYVAVMARSHTEAMQNIRAQYPACVSILWCREA